MQSEAIIKTVFEHHVQPLRALEARNQLVLSSQSEAPCTAAESS